MLFHSLPVQMMNSIRKNLSLKAYNTFGIDVKAKYFCAVSSIEQFQELTQSGLFQNEKRLILGGGSNVLFTKDFDGLIIHNSISGIETVTENEKTIHLNARSGESWHQLVMHCVNNDWGGIENLSLIPGTVGAAPIQNIGAYGIEVSEVIEKVEGVHMITSETMSFSKDECKFTYRESVFKNDLKEKIFISSVTLRLSKKNHRLNTSYGAINDTLKQMNVAHATIQSVSNAVIKIRKEKLPDFASVGNAGSFFKNPEISEHRFQFMKNEFPTMPHYAAANQQVKVPAGWLIEQCGWKGKKINHVGVHPTQALVLVNLGEAKGEEIFSLAMKIIESVNEKFSIPLIPEVNIF
jgi:UDP-N-acetylmuramate dehydrogenase